MVCHLILIVLSRFLQTSRRGIYFVYSAATLRSGYRRRYYSRLHKAASHIQSYSKWYSHSSSRCYSTSHISISGQGGYDVAHLAGTGGMGMVDGDPNDSYFNEPTGMAVDEESKTCFVADSGSNAIRMLSFHR